MSEFIVVKVIELRFLFSDFLADLKTGDFTRIIIFGNNIKDRQFILDFAGIEPIRDDEFTARYGAAKYNLIELFNAKFSVTAKSGVHAGVLAVRDVWLEIVCQNTLEHMTEDSVIEDNTTVRFDSDVRTIGSPFSPNILVSVVDGERLCSLPKPKKKVSQYSKIANDMSSFRPFHARTLKDIVQDHDDVLKDMESSGSSPPLRPSAHRSDAVLLKEANDMIAKLRRENFETRTKCDAETQRRCDALKSEHAGEMRRLQSENAKLEWYKDKYFKLKQGTFDLYNLARERYSEDDDYARFERE